MQNLHFISTSTYYRDVLENIYKYNIDNINDFLYLEEMKFRTWKYGKSEDKNVGKVLIPGEIEIDFVYKDTNIHVKHESIRDNENNLD